MIKFLRYLGAGIIVSGVGAFILWCLLWLLQLVHMVGGNTFVGIVIVGLIIGVATYCYDHIG